VRRFSEVVDQEKLDRLAAATLRHKPKQKYTVGDRIEEKAAAHPQRPFHSKPEVES